MELNIELKKEFLKLLREDTEFRNEVKYLLDVDDLDRRVDSIENK